LDFCRFVKGDVDPAVRSISEVQVLSEGRLAQPLDLAELESKRVEIGVVELADAHASQLAVEQPGMLMDAARD
jgi:hypothetical protein